MTCLYMASWVPSIQKMGGSTSQQRYLFHPSQPNGGVSVFQLRWPVAQAGGYGYALGPWGVFLIMVNNMNMLDGGVGAICIQSWLISLG